MIHIPADTLQRLIDYAHAFNKQMRPERPERPDDWAANSIPRPDYDHTHILTVDWRRIAALGPPSWEKE